MANKPPKPAAAKPMTAKPTVAKPPVVDDASVKESFADDFVGLYGIGPNFHFTFATRRPSQSNSAELSRLVTARLVLPLDAILDMYNSLQNAVARLESGGIIKVRDEAK